MWEPTYSFNSSNNNYRHTYDTFMERTNHSLILFCVFPYVSYYVFLFALIFLDNLPLQACTHIQHSTGVTNRDRFRSCLVRPRCSTTRSYNSVTSFDSHHNTRRSEGELWYRCRHSFGVSNSCAYNQIVSNESLVISIFAREALTDVLVTWKLPPAFFKVGQLYSNPTTKSCFTSSFEWYNLQLVSHPLCHSWLGEYN